MATPASITFHDSVTYALACLKQRSVKLKPEQESAIKATYEGSDVFLWLPTGYGKSICYQVLPFLFDCKLNRTNSLPKQQSMVLVVSPLISLMVDQVKKLLSSGVSAAILSGSGSVDSTLLASETEALAGKFRFLS